jgi:hypothetical protein
MQIDDELATYLRPGPYSVIVAACDDSLSPEVVRAWGTRLLDDGRTIDVCVGREPGRRLAAVLGKRGAMALSIANVTTYQALQLKGTCLEIGVADEADRDRVRTHGAAFVAGVKSVGISERAARGCLVTDVVRLRFAPELLFDQTPGPDAGAPR